MNPLEWDPFSICFYPSCLDNALAFWLQLHGKIVSGTVYVIFCTDISSEIGFSSEKYVWSSNPACSIAALFEKIDCLTHCDSVVVAGIETMVSGDIGSIAGQLDRLYEMANQKLSGLTVLWRADQDYCNNDLQGHPYRCPCLHRITLYFGDIFYNRINKKKEWSICPTKKFSKRSC